MADGIKVSNQLILKWGGYSRLSGWVQCYTKDPLKREERGRMVSQNYRYKDVTRQHSL